MAKVSVTVNGRRYDIGCDDGQEAHVFRLAEDLDRRVGALAAGVGQVGEARLLVLVALMLADELADARRDLEAARGAVGEGLERWRPQSRAGWRRRCESAPGSTVWPNASKLWPHGSIRRQRLPKRAIDLK